MMKWLDSPKHLFAVLRIVAAAAILVGVWLSMSCGVIQVLADASRTGAAGWWYVLTALMNCALWCAAWGSFAGMCTRLMKGGTAFTQENSRTLKVIGGCVGLIGGVMCMRALPRLIASPDLYLVIEGILLPGTFVTVGVIAFILSRLLDHAMALEAEQADVI